MRYLLLIPATMLVNASIVNATPIPWEQNDPRMQLSTFVPDPPSNWVSIAVAIDDAWDILGDNELRIPEIDIFAIPLAGGDVIDLMESKPFFVSRRGNDLGLGFSEEIRNTRHVVYLPGEQGTEYRIEARAEWNGEPMILSRVVTVPEPTALKVALPAVYILFALGTWRRNSTT